MGGGGCPDATFLVVFFLFLIFFLGYVFLFCLKTDMLFLFGVWVVESSRA
jgi:hypothetical protein